MEILTIFEIIIFITMFFLIEFIVVGVIAYKYGRKKGEVVAKEDCIRMMKSIQEDNTKAQKHTDNELKQVGELLFLLTDLMHDHSVFDIFSNSELNELFCDARMVTRYNDCATIKDVEKFICRLRTLNNTTINYKTRS